MKQVLIKSFCGCFTVQGAVFSKRAPWALEDKEEKMGKEKYLAAQILDMDAVGLVELYKKGKIKPSEAVEIYIQHQERFNSNRWVLPFICLANVFGLPAIIVPCGCSEDGLPIGLQVVSTVGNERLVFQVASFLESSFGGYRRNQSYDPSHG